MDLATIRPTQPDPVWAAVATGMYPAEERRALGGALLRPRRPPRDRPAARSLLRTRWCTSASSATQPLTSAAWGARPLWGILSDDGLSSGDRPLAADVSGAAARPGSSSAIGFTRSSDSIAEFDRAGVSAAGAAPTRRRPVHRPGVGVTPGDADGRVRDGSPEDVGPRSAIGSTPASRAALRRRRTPRLFALRYDGLDTVGHYYLRYAQPDAPRDVPEEERRRFAQVVDRYYAFIDGEIGAALDGIAPGDLLLVVSGFGMQPLNPVKRLLARVLGDPDFSGTHERAPDGFLLAYGTAVEPGRPQRGSIVDVTPTLLYFLGLPWRATWTASRASDLFTRDFTAERPVTFIPSYR